MENKAHCQMCDELFKLSAECCKSLRRKYPYRVRWTPEFETWQRFLEDHVGKGVLDVRREVIFDPSSRE